MRALVAVQLSILPGPTDSGFDNGMEVDMTYGPTNQRLKCARVGGLASWAPVLHQEKSFPHVATAPSTRVLG